MTVDPENGEFINVLSANNLPIQLTAGLESESFLPGSYTLDTLDAPTQPEILQVFPQLAEPQIGYVSAARRICTAQEARLFAAVA